MELTVSELEAIGKNQINEDRTFSVRLGGRDGFKSVDRAFVRMWSCKGVTNGTIDKGELFGTDFDGMWPLGGLGGIEGKTEADLGGDRGSGCCTLDEVAGGTTCGGRGVGSGGGFGETARLVLGGDGG